MKKFIFIALIFVLAACSATSEYDQNLSNWNDANISHYRYQLGVSCFCPFGEQMPITIEVKNDEVILITDVNGNEVSESDPIWEILNQYLTIDRLFVSLKSSLNDAEKIEVSYDAEYGFPSSIAVDYIIQAVDDEVWVAVSNFEVLK